MEFEEDIVVNCEEWLQKIGLRQYSVTLIANFSVNEGENRTSVSLRKLSKLKITDFPRMNITDFAHQRAILSHIKESILEAEKVQESFQISLENKEPLKRSSISTILPPISPANTKVIKNKGAPGVDLRSQNRLRKSFDENAWLSIDKLRSSGKKFGNIVNLRNGNILEATNKGTEPKKLRRNTMEPFRRASISADTSQPQSIIDQARNYGNRALKFDIIQSELKSLQQGHLSKLKSVVGCEIANILFLSRREEMLLLYINEQWFRVPIRSSIAGACALSGEILHIKDAYADSRFNRSIDDATGFRTRNILCQPIRMNKGGGEVIAVLQMLNKLQAPDFDEQDVDVLNVCVSKIADELYSHFQGLLNAAEMFHSNGELISDSSTSAIRRSHRYDEATLSYQHRLHSNEAMYLEAAAATRAPPHGSIPKPRPSDAIKVLLDSHITTDPIRSLTEKRPSDAIRTTDRRASLCAKLPEIQRQSSNHNPI